MEEDLFRQFPFKFQGQLRVLSPRTICDLGGVFGSFSLLPLWHLLGMSQSLFDRDISLGRIGNILMLTIPFFQVLHSSKYVL